jgi:DNA-binding NarL/FixJ family response regulator
MRQSDYETSQPRAPLAPDPTVRRLTPREREIVLLVAVGLKDLTIARRLGLSPKTVNSYVHGVLRRLHLSNRTEIVAWVSARLDPDCPEARLRRVPAEYSA